MRVVEPPVVLSYAVHFDPVPAQIIDSLAPGVRTSRMTSKCGFTILSGAGTMSLRDAQEQIATNWTEAFGVLPEILAILNRHRFPVRQPGAFDELRERFPLHELHRVEVILTDNRNPRISGHNRAKARGQADAIKRFVQRFREEALNQPF